jgi:hypothetical protein
MAKNQYLYEIKADILDLKQRVTILETLVKSLNGGTPIPTATKGSTGEGGVAGSSSSSSGGSSGGGQIVGMNTQLLVQATYAIRETTTAMRGYLMLLDQMNISRDQKKAIKQIEDMSMTVLKIASAVKLAMAALTTAANPAMGVLNMALAGGMMASSVAFANKITEVS